MRSALLGLLLALMATSAQAALLGRAPLTPGGTDYQAYFDDVLNVTWLADANLADTNTFGVTASPSINVNGTMSWSTAHAWIAAMNAAGYLGLSDWRLPAATDTGAAGCNFTNSGSDCGYNMDLSAGEIAHLFYGTLGNIGYFDENGVPTGCSSLSPYCLTNAGPFANLQPDGQYWYQTSHATNTTEAWIFVLNRGSQTVRPKTNEIFALAVRDGDIAPIPIPAAAWLLGSGVGLLAWVRRKTC